MRLSFVVFATVLLAAGSASAAVSPDVCQRSGEDFQALALQPSARVDIVNHGGWEGDGVCWWHSRFQRAALYLAMFRPDLQRPSREQALAIINAIVAMNQVVVIPGYPDLAAFTRDYASEIIERLGSWQVSEFFTRANWLRALRGHADLSASVMEGIMERIHDMVARQHRIVFERLHIKGQVVNHAWLVVASRATAEGYDLTVIDSNYPLENLLVHYRRGDTHLADPHSSWTFAPYLDYDGDLTRVYSALNRYCGRG